MNWRPTTWQVFALLLLSIGATWACSDPACANGPIHRTDSIVEVHQIIEQLDPELVLFDIDDSLLTPTGSLGTLPWRKALLWSGEARAGAEGRAAAQRTILELEGLLEMNPVEQRLTPAIIRSLAHRGTAALGLTAREFQLAGHTLAEMKRHGMRVGRQAATHLFPNLRPSLVLPHEVGFADWVLFAGKGVDKPSALRLLSRATGGKPVDRTSMVLVDDSLWNARGFVQAFPRASAIHYTAALKHREGYSAAQARGEFAGLRHRLKTLRAVHVK